MASPFDFDPDDTGTLVPALPRRDPILEPVRGDVLDDDPPAGYLEVFVVTPKLVVAARGRHGRTARWTRKQWAEEMAGARVMVWGGLV